MPKEYNYLTATDEALVDLGQQGDEEAVRQLFERYRNLVKARARSYFLMGGDRDDLIQEGMIGLFKAIRDYAPENGTEFRRFANVCVTRQILTAVKGATRHKHAPLNSYISLNRPMYSREDTDRTLLDTLEEKRSVDPEDIYLRKELLTEIRNNVSYVLSDMELHVLLSYLRGESYRTIAERIQRPVKAVDNAIQRTKRKMELYFKDLKD